MAGEHELKQLFEGMEPSEQELAAYRSRLAATLESRSRRTRGWVWLWAGGPLLASLAVIVWLVSTPHGLPQRTLEELRTLVTVTSDLEGLRETAQRLEKSATGLDRHNATMMLCLTQPDGEALQAAASGVVSDPRPEFRSFYLEYLLDHAEAFELNPDRVEELMEAEEDALCLDLYARLLSLAEWT